MMFRRSAAMVAIALSFTGCLGANEEEVYANLFEAPRTSQLTANSIRGVWAGNSSESEVQAEWRLAFEGDVLHVALRCRFKDGTRLTPGVSIPITYDKNTFTLAHPAENSMKAQSGTACTVSVAGGSFQYAITDNKLPMSVSGRVVLFDKLSD